MKKILIICTGNSCRSQMAEGWLKSFGSDIEVHSAGTFPAVRVSPEATEVMKEKGIDISRQYPKSVDAFLDQAFDYVVTVCDDARESCPVFTGAVRNRLHIGFEDPTFAEGGPEQRKEAFRRTRDEIGASFRRFYDARLRQNEPE